MKEIVVNKAEEIIQLLMQQNELLEKMLEKKGCGCGCGEGKGKGKGGCCSSDDDGFEDDDDMDSGCCGGGCH